MTIVPTNVSPRERILGASPQRLPLWPPPCASLPACRDAHFLTRLCALSFARASLHPFHPQSGREVNARFANISSSHRDALDSAKAPPAPSPASAAYFISAATVTPAAAAAPFLLHDMDCADFGLAEDGTMMSTAGRYVLSCERGQEIRCAALFFVSASLLAYERVFFSSVSRHFCFSGLGVEHLSTIVRAHLRLRI